MRFRAKRRGLDSLTKKELEVVECLAIGMHDKLICLQMGLTHSNLRKRLERIFTILDARSRLNVAVKYRAWFEPKIHAAMRKTFIREQALSLARKLTERLPRRHHQSTITAVLEAFAAVDHYMARMPRSSFS